MFSSSDGQFDSLDGQSDSSNSMHETKTDPSRESELETVDSSADDSASELRLDGIILPSERASDQDSNSLNEDFVTIDIRDDSIIPIETPSISHYVFLVLLFRIQRVVVSFSKWAGKQIFSEESRKFYCWDETKAAILVYFNPETGRKREVDLAFDIPMLNKKYEFRLQLLLEHKSYPDDEEPLQSTGYVNLSYRKQVAEQKGTRIINGSVPGERRRIRLSPVVRVKLYNGESPDMGITSFDEYFDYLPKVVLADLRRYISMNEPLPLNLRTMSLEEFPGLSDSPELFLGLKAMRDVFGPNKDKLLDENFDWLIAHASDFDSKQDYFEFGSLIIRYMDHYQRDLGEGKLEQVDKKFKRSLEDDTMPSVLEKYYNTGLQRGEQRGLQRGEQRGEQRGRREERALSLIIVLDKRFPEKVTDTLRQRIKQIDDMGKLEVLFDFALDCASIEEFERKI